MNGQSMLSFCSNDYLGLANHPDIKRALIDSVWQVGVGSGASHLVSGHHREHELLEQELAEATGRDRVLLFSTGYMANLGAITSLMGKSGLVLEDRLNHASLLDAGLFSGARFTRYLHNDLTSLKKKLQRAGKGDKLIVTDGVFSMDGDMAPMPELAALAEEYDAWLMVDDAHGFGPVGPTGMGVTELFDLPQSKVQVLMGTLGKGFGTFGAFIAGSDALIEYLINTARTCIYTTAMPPALACATRQSLRMVRNESWRRDHLSQLIEAFRAGVSGLGLQLMASNSPIQPVVVGSSEKALAWSGFLRTRGILVTAIRPPTVAPGTARLRITFSAEHTHNDLRQLLQALQEGVESAGLKPPE